MRGIKSGSVPIPLSTGWCQVIVNYYYLSSGGWGHQIGTQEPVGKKIPGSKVHSIRVGPVTVKFSGPESGFLLLSDIFSDCSVPSSSALIFLVRLAIWVFPLAQDPPDILWEWH